MLRVILVGVFAVGAASSCKSDGDRPKVAAGAVAGKVVEVAGQVTATREGKPARPLQIGSDVYGDDEIETAGDASVAILLGHNNARWSVEGGKKTRVDASLAWKLAKQEATAPVDHATTAAGRNAERTAAETQATARSAESAPAQDKAADRATEKMKADSPPPVTAAPMEAPPPPPPPPAMPAPGGTGTGAGQIGGKGGAGADPKLNMPKSAPIRIAPDDDVITLKAPPPGPADDDRIRGLVDKQRAALAKCAAGTKLSITVRVAKGKASFDVTGEASEQVRACIGKVVAKIAFPTVDGAATLEMAK